MLTSSQRIAKKQNVVEPRISIRDEELVHFNCKDVHKNMHIYMPKKVLLAIKWLVLEVGTQISQKSEKLKKRVA